MTKTTGLGEPELIGKKSLFQPPIQRKIKPDKTPKRAGESTPRLRITTDLSRKAMEIIQDLRDEHRLQTGKSLPIWKIISVALEQYGQHKEESDAEKR